MLSDRHFHSFMLRQVHHAMQVRNSASGIVQLTYGDDGLDPVSMEGKDGTPIDFVRTLSQVKAATPNETAPGVAVAAAAAPLPGELLELLEQRLKLRGLVEGSPDYSGKFVTSLKDFILKQVLPHGLVITHSLYLIEENCCH